MALDEFTIHLTERCNLACVYCFQRRRGRDLPFSTIRSCLDSFGETIRRRSFIVFYGGEPLLAFDTIRQTLAYIQSRPSLRNKKFRYSISTNGTVLTEEILSFLNTHRFRVNLSHDGTAQDATRPSPLNSQILEGLDRLLRLRQIELSTNSVFVPATIGELGRTARFFLERGVKDCTLTHSFNSPWDLSSMERMREQVRELGDLLLRHYRRHSTIPIGNFRVRSIRSLFWCSAGQDRLSLTADGRLWGCRFFADFFADKPKHPELKDYCLGGLHQFENGYGDTQAFARSPYGALRQEAFSTERRACKKCPHLLYCGVCPAVAAFATGVIGKIPDWMCDIRGIWQDEARRFWKTAGQEL